jgi:flagella basal body P-ring formation protein FlgA
MNNPRPIGMRKTVQLMVILTLLAWATQTLFHQWGYGGLILPGPGIGAVEAITEAAPATPADPQNFGITLELRSKIKADGTKLTLRDLCRWSDQDQLALEPMADVVVARLGDEPGVRHVSVDQIKSVLHDAGVNLSTVRFSGAATCAVAVGDVEVDATPIVVAKTQADGGDVIAAPKPQMAEATQTSLKDLLLADLHERLHLSARQVQVDFDSKDAAVLALTSPRCRLDFDAGQTGNALGEVVWTVVAQDGTNQRSATIRATARQWEDQMVMTRPLSPGQAILSADVAPRRVLVEKPTTRPIENAQNAVGQVAARALKRGDVLSVGDIDSPRIVRAGQAITVSLKVRDADVETVATALDDGKQGAAIRARNEASGEVYRVRVTAPDAGAQITSDDIVSTGTN